MAGAKSVITTEGVTRYSRKEIRKRLRAGYIRGLFEGEGCFSVHGRQANGTRIPCVVLKMHYRDMPLIEAVRDYFGLRNKVYEYIHTGRHFAMLAIRDTPTLRNKIVPFFKNRLLGHKGAQFETWLRMFPHLDSRKQGTSSLRPVGIEPTTSAM